ncbi:MAG: N-acetylneuraminate synthase family protein [Chitinophagales bacterium]
MIIAEIGQAHEGSIGIAHSYIDALSETGVDAIKFQTHIAEAESSEYEPFRIKFSHQDKSRYDYWKRMEFNPTQWNDLKSHCDDLGLEFISSPFSNKAVEILEAIGVKRYKIGSGEVSNFLMLERIAQTGKPMIISSGMSSYAELDKTAEFLHARNVEFSLLQCTTAYPTKPEQWGLNIIQKLKERYNVPIGFSDHSGDIFACLAAAALGAEIFEFHVVFDKKMFGPDSKASITISQIQKLVKGLREIGTAIGNPLNKENSDSFSELKDIFEKSLSVNKELVKGALITFNDLEAKKPKGYGVPSAAYKDVLGRKLNKTLPKWSFLKYEDISDE